MRNSSQHPIMASEVFSAIGWDAQKKYNLPGGPLLLENQLGGVELFLNALHLWSIWGMIHIRQPSNSISEPRLSVENQVGRLARAVVHQKVPIFVDTSEATTRTTTTSATALRTLSKIKVQNFLDAPFNETCLGYVLSRNLSGNRVTSTFSSLFLHRMAEILHITPFWCKLNGWNLIPGWS